jgi:hypothetical protein
VRRLSPNRERLLSFWKTSLTCRLPLPSPSFLEPGPSSRVFRNANSTLQTWWSACGFTPALTSRIARSPKRIQVVALPCQRMAQPSYAPLQATITPPGIRSQRTTRRRSLTCAAPARNIVAVAAAGILAGTTLAMATVLAGATLSSSTSLQH